MDSLFYNPILDCDTHLRDRIADLDPDMNHFNYIGNCEFSTVDELNERFFANLSFSVLHLNARSLVKNHEDLSHLLANINHKFSVLAITETWIKDDEPYDLNFDGYNFISNHRSGRTGGGVGLYIDEKLTYKVLTEYDTSNSSVLEFLFVEICIPNNKNIIIGAIYRPPTGNLEEFLDKFNELLSGVTRANKHCYVTGDFNLDLMKHETHSITAQFLEALYSYGLIPMITKPTRITAHSATLIDNIFTNNTIQKWFNY